MCISQGQTNAGKHSHPLKEWENAGTYILRRKALSGYRPTPHPHRPPHRRLPLHFALCCLPLHCNSLHCILLLYDNNVCARLTFFHRLHVHRLIAADCKSIANFVFLHNNTQLYQALCCNRNQRLSLQDRSKTGGLTAHCSLPTMLNIGTKSH